jgi:hypothetical protein
VLNKEDQQKYEELLMGCSQSEIDEWIKQIAEE